jgi:hypothetical protein
MILREVCYQSERSIGTGVLTTWCSSKSTSRPKGPDIVAIEEELCAGEGCEISRFTDSIARAESHGSGRGTLITELVNEL